MANRVGQQFGHYQLTRLLGKGGFAEVYLGRHIYLGSEAAIKIILNELSDKDKELFIAEGRTLVRLIHPHIVRLLDLGVKNNIPYLVMDYAPNGSLREKHPHGTRLPLTTIVAYVNQIAAALQYAHDNKLIHRDVKPENILLNHDDEVVISDFGIAVVSHSTKSMNIEEVIGTPYYMAPEQIGGKLRPATDQYALGIIVYSWLTGKLPFTGTYQEIVSQQIGKFPPTIRNIVPTIPEGVEQVVLKALEKDPQQRYKSILDFALALEQASRKSIVPTIRANLPGQNQPQPNGLALTSKTKESWIRKGNRLGFKDDYFDTEKWEEAIEAYTNAIKIDPHYAEAYLQRGKVYSKLKEYDLAINDFSQAISLDPQDAVAYIYRGEAYCHKEIHTSSSRFLGEANYDPNIYRLAIDDFSQAIILDPQEVDTYFQRGKVYSELKDYQQAIKDFTRAIILNTQEDLSLYEIRANTYYKLKMYPQAIEDYNQAISIGRQVNSYRGYILKETFNGLSKIYNELKEYDNSIRNYTYAISLYPENYDYYYQRGEAYWKLNRYRKAIADFSEAIKLNPEKYDTYISRGDIYAELKDYKKAIKDYDLALIIAPKYCYSEVKNKRDKVYQAYQLTRWMKPILRLLHLFKR